MNDAYYTQTGERPELAALEVNPPEGYIAAKIMPVSPVAEKAGSVAYATLTADADAQTSRAAATAPTATQISNSATTWAALEYMKRGAIVPDEVKQMGGIDKADEVGAKWAKRQVLTALESDVCTNVLGQTASNTFDAAKILTDAQTALQSIRLYSGKVVLVSSTATLKRMVQQVLAESSMGPIFSRLIAGTSPSVAVTGMNFESWKAGLAMFLGVDEVLAGDDTVWNATTYDGHFAFCKIDSDPDPLSHKWKPVLGKTMQYMPDGLNPWVIQTVADRVNVNNIYDAYLWMDTLLLNSGAIYVIDGVAE